MLLVIGLVFETPIIVMGLARLGVVSPQWLAQRRRMWFVVAFIIAAIITPTFDPINQAIIAVPLILLLEIGILLSRLVYKKKRETPVATA
jgi:sec-independent protein translocase protein TatC